MNILPFHFEQRIADSTREGTQYETIKYEDGYITFTALGVGDVTIGREVYPFNVKSSRYDVVWNVDYGRETYGLAVNCTNDLTFTPIPLSHRTFYDLTRLGDAFISHHRTVASMRLAYGVLVYL